MKRGLGIQDIRTAEREATAAARELVADCIKSGIYLLPEASLLVSCPARTSPPCAFEMFPCEAGAFDAAHSIVDAFEQGAIGPDLFRKACERLSVKA
jgi:hypothetical protein